MTNFRTALITAKPLYIDGTMRVNFTVDELVNFVEDYLKDNQPILTVEVHEPNKCLTCGKPLRSYPSNSLGGYCSYQCCDIGLNIVKHTQDNHLKTRL